MALDTQQIEKTAWQLRKFLKKSSKRPSASQIHKLRSRTRRFQATLEALGLSSHRNERRLLRDLEGLRKRAGKVRDMDVLTGYVADMDVSQSEKECLVRLLQHLGAERYRHAAKLDRTVQKSRDTLKRRLDRASKHLSKVQLDSNKSPFRHKRAPTDVKAFALDLSTNLEKPTVLNQNNLHPYRLRVKELRYVLQMTDAPTEKDFIERLKEVQNAIGEWHDWMRLIAIAQETLNHGSSCGFIRQLKATSQKKYQAALSVTIAMRRHYLGLKNGNKSSKRAPDSVLRATSSIAA